MAVGIGRRQFISALGGAVAVWPLAAGAQQPGKLPTIGFLGASLQSEARDNVEAFDKRLRELGWIDGHTVAIEYRWAEGRNERYSAIAAEFVRLKVDMIVTVGTAIAAVKQETSTIPIVFAVATDPVASGMVESLARPGGNVTGLSLQSAELGPKRIELLREVVPGLHRLAALVDVGYSGGLLEVANVQAAARKLGLDVDTLEIRRAEDIAPAIDGRNSAVQALYVVTNSLVGANRSRIMALAIKAGLPTICANRAYTEDGGLMSYGPDQRDLFRRAADYVDKILKGTKPSDIPVEQPTKYELVINLKTAKALGLTIPESFLTRADEVIE
jgi:putative ABC transport system substrate-binding protein